MESEVKRKEGEKGEKGARWIGAEEKIEVEKEGREGKEREQE